MASVDNRGRSTPLRHTKVHCQTIITSEKKIGATTLRDDSTYHFFLQGFDARKAGLIKIGFFIL